MINGGERLRKMVVGSGNSEKWVGLWLR
ncbi:unnamed protein product [Spirodela intermedia]|uniref:Uncharacterized protein n=2 Tax=Spirodela intermedia TaxID=51605 RepID=A0A7I8KYI0_SPIIN|nr:unnamed protein product [Spirodela intermedia]CAA6666100.1 unnamed protein product [Spirodela intermedia]CAA7402863.1 unnamed protein product [Spirodela intermedia]